VALLTWSRPRGKAPAFKNMIGEQCCSRRLFAAYFWTLAASAAGVKLAPFGLWFCSERRLFENTFLPERFS